jgi:hypothetical protein
MELQQLMEILTERKAMQQKTDVNLKQMNAKMDGRQEEMKAQMAFLASMFDSNGEEMKTTQAEIKEDIKANQAKTNANREEMLAMMVATMNRQQEKMDAWIAEMKDGRKKGDDVLPRSNGGLSRKAGGKSRRNGIRSGASGGPQRICRSETCRRTEEVA